MLWERYTTETCCTTVVHGRRRGDEVELGIVLLWRPKQIQVLPLRFPASQPQGFNLTQDLRCHVDILGSQPGWMKTLDAQDGRMWSY